LSYFRGDDSYSTHHEERRAEGREGKHFVACRKLCNEMGMIMEVAPGIREVAKDGGGRLISEGGYRRG